MAEKSDGPAPQIISLVTPVLLHMFVTQLAAILLVQLFHADSFSGEAALATVTGNLLVIPVAAWRFRADGAALRPVSLRIGGFCLLAGGLMNMIWSSLLNSLRIQEFFSNQVQEHLFAAPLLLQLFGLGVVAPVAEELIFRGLVYRRMRRIFSVKPAVFFSAVLFAVYHGNPIQMIAAFPMALALAVSYEYGGSLICPILFHAGANLAAILLNIFLRNAG